MNRKIIIHGHIFKNAGSTLDWSLKRCFGSAFLDHRDDRGMKEGASYLGPFVMENPQLKAISTHHLRFPLPDSDQFELMPVMLFRHPVDRAASAYHFERKQKATTPGAINAKKMTFREYVLWRMQPSTGSTIRNFQTISCSYLRQGKKYQATSRDCEAALDFIDNNPLIGVVEKYDQSVTYFEKILRETFPEIDLSYVRQNSNRDNELSLSEKVSQVREELGAETYEMFCRHNEFDFKIYERACEKLSSNSMEIVSESDLEDFRNRCHSLGKVAPKQKSVIRMIKELVR